MLLCRMLSHLHLGRNWRQVRQANQIPGIYLDQRCIDGVRGANECCEVWRCRSLTGDCITIGVGSIHARSVAAIQLLCVTTAFVVRVCLGIKFHMIVAIIPAIPATT